MDYKWKPIAPLSERERQIDVSDVDSLREAGLTSATGSVNPVLKIWWSSMRGWHGNGALKQAYLRESTISIEERL